MKRRNALLGGTGLAVASALGSFARKANASSAPDPSRLNADLTPLGGERARARVVWCLLGQVVLHHRRQAGSGYGSP